jgi:hypothetical protein
MKASLLCRCKEEHLESLVTRAYELLELFIDFIILHTFGLFAVYIPGNYSVLSGFADPRRDFLQFVRNCMVIT